MNKSTAVICSECGEGNFAPTTHAGIYHCTVCHTEITRWETVEQLDADTALLMVDGLLHVVSVQS